MIDYRFYGNISNKKILEYYNNNHIDCFLMPSEYEGLPVSIMEAESAGIPIIATDVGGIQEMIDGNGILMASNPSIEEFANAIVDILKCSESDKSTMRKKSRLIWEDKFDAECRAKLFVKGIGKRFENINHVLFLTEGYPYTNSEKSFLEAELRELLAFYSIIIIPRIIGEITDDMKRNLRNNLEDLLEGLDNRHSLEIYPFIEKWNFLSGVKYGIQYLFDHKTNIEKVSILKSNYKLAIRFWESIKYYGKAKQFYRWITDNDFYKDSCNSNTLVYSYWNLQPLLGLCLNQSSLYGASIIARMHGYDYQDEQWPKSMRKPFMQVLDQYLDAVIFVSKAGKQYYLLKNKQKDDPNKYYVSYIGSNDAKRTETKGISEDFTQNKENDKYILVSCSSLIPLKRVNLIIDTLKIVDEMLLDAKIEWDHFGDGSLRSELEKYAEEVLKNGKQNGKTYN